MELPHGARLLPPEEWHRLAGTDLGPMVDLMVPGAHTVLVMEDAGQIVACWALMPVWTVHGLWVAPTRRTSRIGWRLWQAMRILVRSRGASSVLTTANSDGVRTLLKHVGAVSTGQEYVLSVME